MRVRRPARAAVVILVVLVLTVRWWGRMLFPLPYIHLVEEHCRRYALDPLLVAAMIREESSFDPRAVSSKGALGLMQIMPDTGAWIGEQLGKRITPKELLNPEENIRCGVWYLSTLRDRFRGDEIKALAAYNAGDNRVEGWLAGGIWDGSLADLERLPYAETRKYVVRILRSYRIYRFLYAARHSS